MLPADLFRKEILEDWKSKRSLALKLVLPFIFLVPVALPSLPVQLRASMLPMAALFLGVFGSAIGLVKLREGRMIPRLAVLPVPPHRHMVGYLGANILMDVLQLALPFAVVVLLLGLNMGSAMAVAAVLLSAILASNALGALLAILAGSSGEVHLLAALTVLLIGGASGLFITGGSSPAMVSILPYASMTAVMTSSPSSNLYPLSFLFSVLLLAATLSASGKFFGVAVAVR